MQRLSDEVDAVIEVDRTGEVALTAEVLQGAVAAMEAEAVAEAAAVAVATAIVATRGAGAAPAAEAEGRRHHALTDDQTAPWLLPVLALVIVELKASSSILFVEPQRSVFSLPITLLPSVSAAKKH